MDREVDAQPKIYTSYSLNGAWEMHYQEEKYTGTENPFHQIDVGMVARAGWVDRSPAVIESAVPGYWEDMTEVFTQTAYFNKLRINPAYGLQQYPVTNRVPDMALPNIMGNFFYRRKFMWEQVANAPASIHFDGVQNAVSVWLNDVFLGRHEGYSTPFDMEIPSGILRNGENTVVLSVSNYRLQGYDGEPISGLTSRAANEYTGGITGDVEIRVYHCPVRDVDIRVAEDGERVCVNVDLAENTKTDQLIWEVYDEGLLLKSGRNNGKFSFDTDGLECWSPETPKMYTLRLICAGRELSRKFGVRRLTVEGEHFRLNGLPYYLRGICEHGYFPETVHPNHDAKFYRNVIRKVKALGFNFIRFHTYIPEEEYMQAADELGILIHVESPNNTTISEWEEIVRFCRRHPSVVIYCCGNELPIDEPFIEHLRQCADIVHENTDALFSPMSALSGLEYMLEAQAEVLEEPFRHHPRRIETVANFSDLFSSYPNGQHSYFSTDVDVEKVDDWGRVYGKPRVSHEICIDGTYTDLSLKDRYKGTRVGKTEMFSSIERHLEKKGLLKKAPLYFRNSSEWQRRIRKYCFEAVRRGKQIAGYDFLGPIDTHWHTFGYDVGMMNEFYELKPGETVRNVRMYNSPTVLLNDLSRKTNFTVGEHLETNLYVSHYGRNDLFGAELTIRLSLEEEVIVRRNVRLERVENGKVSKLHQFVCDLPQIQKPGKMKLYVTLDGDGLFVENEWELYLFPGVSSFEDAEENLIISTGMELAELIEHLKMGKDVLLFGTAPFVSLPTTFRIGLAGRTSGNLATVIADHPALGDFVHEGFCGWQFSDMLEGGKAVCFEADSMPFDPIVEVVSTHKYAIRQAAVFEFRVMNGRLLVCGLNLQDTDPSGKWLRHQLIRYAGSSAFEPRYMLNETELIALSTGKVKRAEGNTNLAFNANDVTAVRKGKTQ